MQWLCDLCYVTEVAVSAEVIRELIKCIND